MHRKFAAVMASLFTIGLIAGCSSSESSSNTAGNWSFTDDRGKNVTADTAPRRIIGQVSAAGALQDFGVPIAGTFGPLTKSDGSTEPEAGSIVPRKVTDVTGNSYGELNMERVASVAPDLLISGKYSNFPGLWHLNEQQEEKVGDIVPTVGIQQSGKPLPDTIARYRELAEALGADVNSPKVKADEHEFHQAAERLRELGSELRSQHRTILAVGGTPQEYYVVSPSHNPDLDYYVESLGLPITEPDNPDLAGGGYFEHLSWENASAYDGDILFWDTRAASLSPKEMKRNPVFAALPAAAANRFVGWDAVAPMSYASYAEIMNKLADELVAKMGTLR